LICKCRGNQVARKTAKQNDHHCGAGFIEPEKINLSGFGLSNTFFHRFPCSRLKGMRQILSLRMD
jgi:hypothetical protein